MLIQLQLDCLQFGTCICGVESLSTDSTQSESVRLTHLSPTFSSTLSHPLPPPSPPPHTPTTSTPSRMIKSFTDVLKRPFSPSRTPHPPPTPPPTQPPSSNEDEDEDEWVILSDGDITDGAISNPDDDDDDDERTALCSSACSSATDFDMISVDDVSRVEYGFRVSVASDASFTAAAAAAEQGAAEWDALDNPRSRGSRTEALVVAYGIPPGYRPALWPAFLGSDALGMAHGHLYPQLLDTDVPAAAGERILVDRAQIELDLRRTFPSNEYFASTRGVDELRKLLLAFVTWSPVGYCQSLNFVAGMLLLVLDSPQAALWALVCIVENKLPGYYSEGMPLFQADSAVLGVLLETHLPHLAALLESGGFALSLVTSQWFLCLYINSLPLPYTLHVWDAFMYHGPPFLFQVALQLFALHRQDLQDSEASFEVMYHIMTTLPALSLDTYSPHDLVRDALEFDVGDLSLLRSDFLQPGTIPRLQSLCQSHRRSLFPPTRQHPPLPTPLTPSAPPPHTPE